VSRAFDSVFREDVEDTFLGPDCPCLPVDPALPWTPCNPWTDPEYCEFASCREFSFKNSDGTYLIQQILVIWNHDILRALPTTVLYGQLLVGDVLLLVKKHDWPQRPRRGQVVWTPRDTPWTILNCQEILRTLYRISLEAIETQV
jgi:hypothetical protein